MKGAQAESDIVIQNDFGMHTKEKVSVRERESSRWMNNKHPHRKCVRLCVSVYREKEFEKKKQKKNSNENAAHPADWPPILHCKSNES